MAERIQKLLQRRGLGPDSDPEECDQLSRDQPWLAGLYAAPVSGKTAFGAIATFKDGKYANLPTGNHAAIYLNQDSTGPWVMDQWVGKTSGRVKKRLIRFHEAPWNPINDGNAYSVIE